MPTVLLLVDFVEGTGDGEIQDLAKLIQDHACVRTVRGMGENLLLRNPAAQRILREAAADGTPIHTLELTVRVRNALKADNVFTVQQLCQLTEQELLKIPSLQRKGVSEIQEVLHSHGLRLKD